MKGQPLCPDCGHRMKKRWNWLLLGGWNWVCVNPKCPFNVAG
jgi:hypothetical protein